MTVPATDVLRERRFFGGTPDDNLYITGEAAETLERLTGDYSGRVSLIYMDPPFYTGKRFEVRVRVGENEWKKGQGSLTLPAYDDKCSREEYLSRMKRVLTASRELLSDDGLIFVHIDWHMHAHIKLLMDEVMGEKNFINEIVWTYETGGRAKNFFSRKHDIILMYSKTGDYDLHTADVAVERSSKGKTNHMRKQYDEDGRLYRTITSGGKVYRYYDDEAVPPSDVWDDISHLQQKDPQRTGYDTQKPLALLERIVKCASREGDTVLDPFCGSGTTLEAAAKNRRRFIGIDRNPMCAQFARRRTEGSDAVFEVIPSCGTPDCELITEPGLVNTTVKLTRFRLEEGGPETSGLDAVDSWSAGCFEDGVYTALSRETRTFRKPGLKGELEVPAYHGQLMARVSDITGRDFFFRI